MIGDIMDSLYQIFQVSLGRSILLLTWTFFNLLYSCLHRLMRGLESHLFTFANSSMRSDTADHSSSSPRMIDLASSNFLNERDSRSFQREDEVGSLPRHDSVYPGCKFYVVQRGIFTYQGYI